jgi:hypothetical protein
LEEREERTALDAIREVVEKDKEKWISKYLPLAEA